MLGKVQSVKTFNDLVTLEERSEFVNFISASSNIESCVVKLLSCLNLFTEKNSGRGVSVNDVNITADTDDLPIQYFQESLECIEKHDRNLANSLGVKKVEKEQVIIDILQNIKSQYSQTDIVTMMEYVLKNLSYFYKKDAMVEIAKNIEFVYNKSGQIKRASDLFDPEDNGLRMIILDENLFPCFDNLHVEVELLRKIGLKSSENLTGDNILECAKHIENNCNESVEKVRSERLMEILQGHCDILETEVKGKNVAQHLSNIRFIQPSLRTADFPFSLPWFSAVSFYRPIEILSAKYAKLVGSVKPVLDKMPTSLIAHFDWNKEPDVKDVIKQLLIITEKYEDKNKPELLPVINIIYRFLADHYDGSGAFEELKCKNWIWMGNGFKTPDRIYLQQKPSDISLYPYVFPLPSEFHDSKLFAFFQKLGCIDEQTTKLLIGVEHIIQEEYSSGKKTNAKAKADLKLIVSILNVVKDAPEDEVVDVLLPIQQTNNTRVVLKPAKECNYCRDEDDIYGDEGDIIHHDISPDTACKLGVKSLTDTLLDDAERLEEWGQNEPLTRRIKDLLKSYKDGLSVPKEIIQNADDAGATIVRFMYDERGKDGYGKRLLDKNMMECQGPSLWAYNNAKFTADDLKNITKVSGATKEEDTTKIGKFGLGFCSVYNLTEVPSFVTGNQMVIFDPHYDYLADALKNKKQPGLKIDFQRNRKILEMKDSQFRPFNGVFGCNLDAHQGQNISYDGTLFRLPLRTKRQAVESEISNTHYDHDQMKRLMKIFFEAGGNILLFTQNVNDIEFYHLPFNEPNPEKATLLYSIRRKAITTIERHIANVTQERPFSVVKDYATKFEKMRKGQLKDVHPVQRSILSEISIVVDTRNNLLASLGTSCSGSSTFWFVTWASGTGSSKDFARTNSVKGVIPLASVACPLQKIDNSVYGTIPLEQLSYGFYNNSHLFCYLPLPVGTPFPVHINASFAVSSDRRRIICKTTDSEDKDSFESDWNEILMADTVCNAYILFLEDLHRLGIDPNENYYKMWPLDSGNDGNQNFKKLKTSYFRTLTDTRRQCVVFRRTNQTASFCSCLFLDPCLMDADFWSKAFEVCVKHLDSDSTRIMELPKTINDCFRSAGCEAAVEEKILDRTAFYTKMVFPKLNDGTWDTNVKDELIIHALDNASGKMFKMLKDHNCIPTAPNRRLRRPNELVNKQGKLCKLFNEEDERFVINDTRYIEESHLKVLIKLGMMESKLPDELLIDRAQSIKRLADICPHCAKERSEEIVKYIHSEIANIETNHELFSQLKKIQFLPVKNKSQDWEWTWGGDRVVKANAVTGHGGVKHSCQNKLHKSKLEVKFECPVNLYSQTRMALVCALHPVLDQGCFQQVDTYRDLFKKLGIKWNVTVQDALENLLAISKSVSQLKGNPEDLQSLRSTVYEMYDFLSKCTLKESKEEKISQHISGIGDRFKEEPILLLNGMFVKPCKVVVSISENCSPHFYGLNNENSLKSMKGLLALLQIEDRCSSQSVLSTLLSYRTEYNEIQMDEEIIQLYVRLLKVLVCSMKLDNWSPDDVRDLFIPDRNGILYPINNVCLDEINVSSLETMHFTHDSIAKDLAKALGIKTKKQQKVEDCSADLYSEDFGQHEELITRIRRILDGYPCDVSVLKELVQNADDAAANEIHIVLDLKNHSTENLFGESWEPLQGPAILVFNDSYFSEADIKGIQNLGLGSKACDPTKTGQYGVGFNAVYHLTDVPSFLSRGPGVTTGEVLCVFDPHCKFVPKATCQNPGRKYIKTEILKEDHPNVFACYHDKLLMQDQGTIFRLPLRTEKFQSEIKKDPVTEEDVRELLLDFEKEMNDMLLFVNNVKSIKISEFVGCQLKEIFSVMMKISPDDEKQRHQFNQEIEKSSKIFREKKDLGLLPFTEISYQVEVDASSYAEKTNWLIVRRIGCSDKKPCPESIIEACKDGNLGLLPRGGVALPIPNKIKEKAEYRGRVFCFLPLPIDTGLPVHFNGHFALDHEARRNLWTDENGGYKSDWNKYLLERVIAPTYASALIEMKKVLGFKVEKGMNKIKLRNLLARYHSCFPDFEKAKTDYFQCLVSSLYKWIFKHELVLFPSAKQVGKSQEKLTFYPLKGKDMTFPCVFDTHKKTNSEFLNIETVKAVEKGISRSVSDLEKTAQKSKDDPHKQLTQLCKELGMKLLDSPKFIFKSLKKGKVKVSEMTPDFLIKFLKSFKTSNADRCLLSQLDENIENTPFKTIPNLITCIEYCQQSKTFNEQVDGLPFCLTEDGILRSFKKDFPVYFSSDSHLLKESASSFIHSELCHLFSSNIDGLKVFNISGFVDLLPYTLQFGKYKKMNDKVMWNPESDSVPNIKWLQSVWKFIDSSSRDFVTEASNSTNHTRVTEESISPLLEWCLLPCNQTTITGDEHVLFPVGKAKNVLNLDTYTPTMQKALESLQLPTIDPRVILKNDSSILCSILVSSFSPCDLVNYLHNYRDKIRKTRLTMENCTEILQYLLQHLKTIIKDEKSKSLLTKIKEIPCHTNVSGQNVSLDSSSRVLVLSTYVSEKMVLDGIEKWAKDSGTILLIATDTLTKLYVKLGFTTEKLEVIDIYNNFLIPKFSCLPRMNHLAHLTYIRDKLLVVRSVNKDEGQQRLEKALKDVHFIPNKDGILQKASSFKNPFNMLMKIMCNPDEFPSAPFSDISWEYFLRIAGIKTEVTFQMVVNFARLIEHDGKNGITEDVKKKSKMLTEHLIHRNEVEPQHLLGELSGIRFVLPHTVEDWRSKIFGQKDSNLICYRDSVPESLVDLCWTTCSILPNFANPRKQSRNPKEWFSKLNIRSDPPIDNVMRHLDNICGKMETMIKNEKGEVPKLKNMMIKIYEWLNEKRGSMTGLIIDSLKQKPIVYLPDTKLFVTCNRMVKNLDSKRESEIIPYLMQIPDDYGKYFKLFEQLGMNKNPTLCNYVRVLEHLKTDVKDSVLHVNELNVVKRALQQLVDQLCNVGQEELFSLEHMDALFLLTRKKKLRNASTLVLSDNADLEEKIGSEIGMPFVMNFQDLAVYPVSGSASSSLKKLPKKLQPNILSEMITRKLALSSLTFVLCGKGLLLKQFFSSHSVKEAIVRISVHCGKRCRPPVHITKGDAEKIVRGIDKLKIVQVESIRLNLLYKDKAVGQSEETCFLQCKPKDGEVAAEQTLYCSFKEKSIQNWLTENIPVIANALATCTENLFMENAGLLLTVFTNIENPAAISKSLDKREVQEYSLSQKVKNSVVLPPAGVTVHQKWHRFLDCNFTSFEPGEYVALLLSDETVDGDNFAPAVYIYAIIVRKLESDCKLTILAEGMCYYEVDTGNGRIEKRRALDIFKIIRSDQDQIDDDDENSTEIALFTGRTSDIPQQHREQSLEDIFKEVRETLKAAWTLPEDERKKIIKRLFKKWHPDKNYGNEKIATEVFKYIRTLVLRLENGESIDESSDGENRSSTSGSSSYRRRNDDYYERYRGNSTFWQHFRSWEWSAGQDKKWRGREDMEWESSGSSSFGTRRHYRRGWRGHYEATYEPVPSVAEARQWLRQAKRDFTAAVQFMPHAETGPHFNWICIMCYQSVEKVLKALYFQKDSNKVPSTSDLRPLAAGLGGDLQTLKDMVERLTNTVGSREKTMYPDRLNIPDIPSDMFTKTTAETAQQITQEILDFVTDRI